MKTNNEEIPKMILDYLVYGNKESIPFFKRSGIKDPKIEDSNTVLLSSIAQNRSKLTAIRISFEDEEPLKYKILGYRKNQLVASCAEINDVEISEVSKRILELLKR